MNHVRQPHLSPSCTRQQSQTLSERGPARLPWAHCPRAAPRAGASQWRPSQPAGCITVGEWRVHPLTGALQPRRLVHPVLGYMARPARECTAFFACTGKGHAFNVVERKKSPKPCKSDSLYCHRPVHDVRIWVVGPRAITPCFFCFPCFPASHHYCGSVSLSLSSSLDTTSNVIRSLLHARCCVGHASGHRPAC